MIISAQERGDGSGRPSRGNGAGRGDGTGRGEGRGEGRGQGRGEGRGEGRGDGQRERPTQEERDVSCKLSIRYFFTQRAKCT